jgi:hypothetical protein
MSDTWDQGSFEQLLNSADWPILESDYDSFPDFVDWDAHYPPAPQELTAVDQSSAQAGLARNAALIR